MTIFNVLEPPDGKPEKVAFLPEGFSWGALALTVLWALWHRMWVVAALLFVLSSALTAAAGFGLIGPAVAALLQFGAGLIFAFEARGLQAMSLERSGYRRAGLIQASGFEAAELTYFAGRTRSSPTGNPVPFRAAPDDTLGIFGNV